MASLLTSTFSLHSSMPTTKPLQAFPFKSSNSKQLKIRAAFGAESQTLPSGQSSKSFDSSIRPISLKNSELDWVPAHTLKSDEKFEEPQGLDWSYFDRLGLPFTEEELLANVAGGDVVDDDSLSFVTMAVPKKRTSRTKSRLRKNFWKRKANVASKKAFSLAKSISTGNSKSFFVPPTNKESS